MKTLANDFNNISPEMLDDWFFAKMEKYKNSPMYLHLLVTYKALTGCPDSFADYVYENYSFEKFSTRAN